MYIGKYERTCTGDKVKLKCGKDETIKVIRVFYGRHEKSWCKGKDKDHANTTCSADNENVLITKVETL